MEEDEGIVLPNFSNYIILRQGKVYNIKKDIYMSLGKDGLYSSVVLVNDDGNRVGFLIHQLLAEAFLDNPENKPTVDHIDRDTFNNHLSNLRWATYKEQNNNTGPRKGRAVRRIRYDGDMVEYISIREAADNNNFNKSRLARYIRLGKEYEGYRYIYLDSSTSSKFGNEWRFCTIKGSEDLEASDLGFVRLGDKILNIGLTANGYQRIKYNKVGFLVHIIVMSSFEGEVPEKYVIDHIDGNRLNNRLDNLQYVTRSENNIRASELGRGSSQGIRRVDILTGQYTCFRSMAYASEICNISSWKLDRTLKTDTKLDKTGKFYFIKEKDIRPIRIKHVKTGEVTRYDTNIEAAVELGLLIDDIKFLCEDYKHSYKGYKFYYDD